MIRSSLIVLSFLFLGSAGLASAADKIVPIQKTKLSRKEILNQLREARKLRIAALKNYVRTGRFPWGAKGQNLISKLDPHFDAKHERTHRFRGANGQLCALAQLIWNSGDKNLVTSIEKKNNHFCLGMDKNPGVEAWILSSGLTKEECLNIQRPGFRAKRPKRPNITVKFQQQEIRKLLKKVIRTLEKESEESLTLAADRILKAAHSS